MELELLAGISMSFGMAAEQLEKQVPAGRRRFENSRENKLASSQRLASVN